MKVCPRVAATRELLYAAIVQMNNTDELESHPIPPPKFPNP